MINLKSAHAALEVLNTELTELQDTLSNKESDRDSVEICVDDFEDQFCECLDECNGDFMGYSASYLLRNVDPIAYRCGLVDYCDSVDVEQLPEYKELQEEVETLESEIEDLEINIEEVEEEIAELEEEEI